ncbi:unnamed protein product [Strongylus vulgaris]|uniref:Uncharacterized protein n=1 Tax=Strongylus vulgaris TaxID=40348 RepID=A0A3P7K6E1_STRVU|nr:unnamed protein product [Strongylus vulgaris]
MADRVGFFFENLLTILFLSGGIKALSGRPLQKTMLRYCTLFGLLIALVCSSPKQGKKDRWCSRCLGDTDLDTYLRSVITKKFQALAIRQFTYDYDLESLAKLVLATSKRPNVEKKLGLARLDLNMKGECSLRGVSQYVQPGWETMIAEVRAIRDAD